MTTSPLRTDRLRRLTRDQPRYSARQAEILDHLEEVFLLEGFRSLTIGDLAKRVRCSTRTLYELAPTREELLLLVVGRMWDRMRQEVREAMGGAEGPAARLRAYISAGVAILWAPYSTLLDDIAAYGPTRHLFEEEIESAIGMISEIVAEGISSGDFRATEPRMAAEFLAAGAIRVTSHDVLRGRDPVDTVAEMTDIFLNGLSTSPGARKKLRTPRA